MTTPIEIVNLHNSSYVARTSWSASITVPADKGPTTVLVIAHCRNNAFPNDPLFAGSAMTPLRYRSVSYSYIEIWYVENVPAGTYNLSMNGIANTYSTGIAVVGMYKTSGQNPDNDIVATGAASSMLTVNPVLQAGHIWVEFTRQRTQPPTAGSSQTTLLTNDTLRIFYKKDLPTGSITSKINGTAEGTEMAYIGYEFLPPGSLFSVPPMPIG